MLSRPLPAPARSLGFGPDVAEPKRQNSSMPRLKPQPAPVRPKTIAADTAQAVRTLSAGAHQARTAALPLRKRPNRLSAFPKLHPKPLPKHRQQQKKPRIQTICPVLT